MKAGASLDFLTKITASVFFIGYLPLIPGTFGSAAGLGLFYLVHANWQLYLSAIFGAAVLGLLTSGRMERVSGRKDPRCVVIDEVMGMLIALFAIPAEPKVIVLGFIFFRLFDTLKPYPAGRLQHLPGAVGIMADDLVAGIYTNAVLQLILKLNQS